jgi:hypothetical protein
MLALAMEFSRDGARTGFGACPDGRCSPDGVLLPPCGSPQVLTGPLPGAISKVAPFASFKAAQCARSPRDPRLRIRS